ncbi:MAG: hypothetical protein KatS3mg002_1372 [Candidatus Woesearchaeota archaeon]|nr:MAG: hypothetical protein KatS3mg002_1372 [Candidatus Woesearchaeota archaeon]
MGGLKPTTITEGWGGNSVNSTHLIRTYGLDKPHDLSYNATNIAQLFSATDRYKDKPLIGMTEAKGKKIYLSSRQYTWKLIGHMKQAARVTSVVETSTEPGRNEQTFKIRLDKGWFDKPDIIQGQAAGNNFPLEVISKTRVGLEWEYEVQLHGSDPNRSFPVAGLQINQEFYKVGTTVRDESNNEYGTMQFNSIFELRNQLGNVAEKIEFTDKALRIDKNSGEVVQKLKSWRVPFLDNKGKKYYNFMPMAEAEVFENIYQDIEWALNFGRKGLKMDIVNNEGYVRTTGPGFRQQSEDGHVLTHNGNLTLSRLDEFLTSIYRGRKDATPANRKIVLSTGEMGAKMFHEMVLSDATSFLTLNDSLYIDGKDFRHLSYGVQFTHYRGSNGLDVTVMLDPSKDNPIYCPQTHPVITDACIDSWRMDIMDFGQTAQSSGETGDNISMVCEKFADYYFTTAGKWDPKTGMPINDGSHGVSGGVSGYATYVEKSFGLMIRDISRCGVIKLNFDN